MVHAPTAGPAGATRTTDPGPARSPVVDLRSPEQAALRASVFDALPDASALVDAAGIISDVNRAWATFCTLNGGDPRGMGRGADYLETCDRAAAGGDTDAHAVATGLRGVLEGRLRSFEYRYPCPSELEDRWFVVRVAPVPGHAGALVSHLDVTAAKLSEDRLAHRATHDPLTGLPNREAVLSVLRGALSRLNRTGRPVAVLFLDLDGFKPVNDRYGHEAGDRLLVTVANRLVHQLRANDVIARVGGDEFVAVCDATAADALADRLRAAVSAPMQVGDDVVQVTASIGVAIATDGPGPDIEAAARVLLAQADEAMYAAKRAGPRPT